MSALYFGTMEPKCSFDYDARIVGFFIMLCVYASQFYFYKFCNQTLGLENLISALYQRFNTYECTRALPSE